MKQIYRKACRLDRLSQLKANGPAGLPLPDIVFVNRIAVVRHVIDAQCNEVTATQFAVNGEIEHCQVARAFLQIQPGAYRPYVTGSQGRLWASDLPLFQVDQGTLAAELVSVIVGLLR
jgi:hypothetical protein